MNPALIIPTLVVLFAMACSPATAQAPTRVQAEAFLSSSRTGQQQLATIKAIKYSAVPPCPCRQRTCMAVSRIINMTMNGRDKCFLFPTVTTTECTRATNGIVCPEVFGWCSVTGICTHWNPTTRVVLAVCFPPSGFWYITLLGVRVHHGCCCM